MALALCACQGVPQRVLVPVPPESAGGWVRRGLETPDAADAPEPMHSLHAKAWVRARYFREHMSVEVNAFGFEAAAGALESAQRWRAYDRAVVSLRGRIFIVCSSIDAGPGNLREFVRSLEAAWFGSAS
jgi:hypothetical protein